MSDENFDRKFTDISGRVINCILLSVLWTVFSLPVFTAGASAAALLKSCRDTVLQDKGYVWKSFWSFFKSEFKRATIIWLIVLAAETVLYMDLRLILSLAEQNNTWHVLTVFCLVIIVFAAGAGFYALMQELCLGLSVRDVLKNAVLLAFGHMGRTFLTVIICAAAAAVCVLFPFLLIVLPGIAGVCCCKITETPIRKYFICRERMLEG